eukprot:scaffold104346_cov19-Tisochrysis_lutea.AAC.1
MPSSRLSSCLLPDAAVAVCAREHAVPCRTTPSILATYEVAAAAHWQTAAAESTAANAGKANVLAGREAAHWQGIRTLGLQLA